MKHSLTLNILFLYFQYNHFKRLRLSLIPPWNFTDYLLPFIAFLCLSCLALPCLVEFYLAGEQVGILEDYIF